MGEEVDGRGGGGAEGGGEGVEVVAERFGSTGAKGLEVGVGEAVPAGGGEENVLPAFGAGGDGFLFGVDGALVAEGPAFGVWVLAVFDHFGVEGEAELLAEAADFGGG